MTAHADSLDAVQQVLANVETSPIPQGWMLGGAVYSGSSVYSAGKTSTLAVPGAVYLGNEVMFLGDRAYYTFHRQGSINLYGRLRVRLGNLDPEDSPDWVGLTRRKGQLEAGLGAVMVSTVGLWTARFSSDVSGHSHGTEVLLNWSVPIIRERWMVMGGAGVFWRSRKLANYYFGGVSAAESTAGRPAYDVGDTWSFAPSLVASYRLGTNWILGTVLSYEALARAVQDSPLVEKKGRYDALVALGYVWR